MAAVQSNPHLNYIRIPSWRLNGSSFVFIVVIIVITPIELQTISPH